MIYEPQHLKTKKAMYDKRDKWLFRLAFFIWLVLFCIYGKAVSAVYPHAKSVLGFLGIMIGIIFITILYFLLVLFVFAFIRRGNPFIRRNNAIVKEYREHQNTELFVEKLLEIEEDPKNIINQITWYLNISIAFEVLGRDEECITLLRQVEEVSTGKK